jgi:predicted dehydrogenase
MDDILEDYRDLANNSQWFCLDGNYDELLCNEEIDIIYVGCIHAFRRTMGEKILLAHKHCLLEKPFACNSIDAKYLISLARERNLFFMEVRVVSIGTA